MLARIAPSLATLALVTLAGLALQALLAQPLERGRTARVGFAYLLGAAWLGLALWFGGFLFGLEPGRASALALLAAPVVAAAVVVTKRRSAGGLSLLGARFDRRGWRARWPGALVAAVIAAEAIALVAHAAAEPVTDFDGRMTWGTRAQYLRASRSVLPEALRDETFFVVHPRYPIVMPLLQVATVELGGESFDGSAVRPLYALFLPAFAAALWPSLKRTGGASGATIASLLLLAAPILLADRDGGPLGTYSDFPLASFLGAGLLLLVDPRTRRERWRGWPAGLLLAAAAGTKNEGMVLALAAVAAVWFVARRSSEGGWRALWRPATIVVLALALIVAWRGRIPNRNDEGYLESLPLTELVANLPERAGVIASSIWHNSFDRASWGRLFWIAPPILVMGARGLRRRVCRVASLLVVSELALVTAAYSVVVDLEIIEVTWNRFVLQLTAPLALLLAAGFGRTWWLARRRVEPARRAVPGFEGISAR